MSNASETAANLSKNAEQIDEAIQVAMGRLTGGLSPAALALAFMDWLYHLAAHPGRRFELYQMAMQSIVKLYGLPVFFQQSNACPLREANDRRFTDTAWQHYPFNFIYESFLECQNFWHCATSVPGVSTHHTQVVDFMVRQWLDMLSPSNSLFTNPQILETTFKQQGSNLIDGLLNFLDDCRRMQNNEPPFGAENFVIGENVAITKGEVIFRNQLIELIQYAPTTKTVYERPILITPAWIMKYYILDLSPKHSLVKYLVNKGHTVFIISWKNPDKNDAHLSMEDYQQLGVMQALDVIGTVLPKQKVNLLGYCLGGTLAAITAATLARDNKHRLESLTLLAAQTDFTEPGELGLFIDESQISFLENIMKENGYLDTHQMSGAFQLLRSNDLIWSRMIKEYLLGDRKPLSDLMAWNADATRLPYKMHSEYLRQLFLNNELAEAKYFVHGKPIALSDISVPIFVVATERDHVSPWHSVFKINTLTSSDVTFLLTSGGHNVGIVSMPSKKTRRHYRISTLKEKDRYIDAETWFQQNHPKGGSWWPAYETWLAALSGDKIAPPSMGAPQKRLAPLMTAPGSYVLQK